MERLLSGDRSTGARRMEGGQRFPPDQVRYGIVPVRTRRTHPVTEERIIRLAEFVGSFPYNRVELGKVRAANVALLGAVSTFLEVPPEIWLAVIEARVPPKHVEPSRKAFVRGRQAVAGK